MKILTAFEMGEVDRLSTEIYRIPSILLMESAGRGVAEEIKKAIPHLPGKRVLIFCGKGNNGGDGFVVARYLQREGGNPEVLLFADPNDLKGNAKVNWEMVEALGIAARIFLLPGKAAGFLRKTVPPDVIVDALFGTGLSKPLGREFKPIIDWINQAAARSRVVSVDIPSGLFADSQAIPGPAVKAHFTVTFTAPKLAQVLPPAADNAGKLILIAIGSPRALLEKPSYSMEWIDAATVRSAIPIRERDSHKGSFGHVYIVAGSRGKSGAALMAGLAALRTGAGLATLWLPESLQQEVVGKFPEIMTESLPETRTGSADRSGLEAILSRLDAADALVVGPGLTTASPTVDLVHRLVQQSTVPVILDADGINAFAGAPSELKNHRGQPIVITPHPGEMARLIGFSTREIQADRIGTAREFSRSQGCFTVLKGYQTVVASPKGRILINSSGNPGMATGGSGDVLAGMAGCFAGWWKVREQRGEPEFLASQMGAAVYLHGLAGDFAVRRKGMESVIATDLIEHLPDAFNYITVEKPADEVPSGS